MTKNKALVRGTWLIHGTYLAFPILIGLGFGLGLAFANTIVALPPLIGVCIAIVDLALPPAKRRLINFLIVGVGGAAVVGLALGFGSDYRLCSLLLPP